MSMQLPATCVCLSFCSHMPICCTPICTLSRILLIVWCSILGRLATCDIHPHYHKPRAITSCLPIPQSTVTLLWSLLLHATSNHIVPVISVHSHCALEYEATLQLQVELRLMFSYSQTTLYK